MKLNVPKPHPIGYPKELITIGDYIRARRMDLGLFQEEVAQKIGVCGDSIAKWGKGCGSPKTRQFPKIIEFLGDVPFQVEIKTLGDRIKFYRLKNGMTTYDLAVILGVHPTTIGAWEKNKQTPKLGALRQLENLI